MSAHDVSEAIVNAFDRIDVAFGRDVFDGKIRGRFGILEALVVELAASVATMSD